MRSVKLSGIVTLALLSLGNAIVGNARAYLHTISKRDASACYNVMDADRRALCHLIISPSVRDKCMAQVKK